jgi:hypothetical protein
MSNEGPAVVAARTTETLLARNKKTNHKAIATGTIKALMDQNDQELQKERQALKEAFANLRKHVAPEKKRKGIFCTLKASEVSFGGNTNNVPVAAGVPFLQMGTVGKYYQVKYLGEIPPTAPRTVGFVVQEDMGDCSDEVMASINDLTESE